MKQSPAAVITFLIILLVSMPAGTAHAYTIFSYVGVVGTDGELFSSDHSGSYKPLGGSLLAAPAVVSLPK
jgi:hypothetical protein